MTGDLGSEAGGERSRPSFLPPVDGYPPPGPGTWEPAPGPAAGQPHSGTAWTLATIAAAAALLVSAFLPWAHAQIIVELFGRPIGRDLGSLAGIDADTMVLAVPVLAVIAVAFAFWDMIGRDARVGALAAIPGTLSLLVCGIFVVRLGDVRDNLPRTALDFGYQITLRYGWYTAVIASLLVVGFSLARPIAGRVSRSPGQTDRYEPRPLHADQRPYYLDRQYYPEQGAPERQDPADAYAAWPQEDRAWGRRAENEAPRGTEEPGKDHAPGQDQS